VPNHHEANLAWRVLNSTLPDEFIDLRVDVEFLVFLDLEVADDLFADDLHGSWSPLVPGDVPCVPEGNN